MLDKIGFTEIIYNLDKLVVFYLEQAFDDMDRHYYLSAFSWLGHAEAVVSSASILGCFYGDEFDNIMDCLLEEKNHISVLEREHKTFLRNKKLGVC